MLETRLYALIKPAGMVYLNLIYLSRSRQGRGAIADGEQAGQARLVDGSSQIGPRKETRSAQRGLMENLFAHTKLIRGGKKGKWTNLLYLTNRRMLLEPAQAKAATTSEKLG